VSVLSTSSALTSPAATRAAASVDFPAAGAPTSSTSAPGGRITSRVYLGCRNGSAEPFRAFRGTFLVPQNLRRQDQATPTFLPENRDRSTVQPYRTCVRNSRTTGLIQRDYRAAIALADNAQEWQYVRLAQPKCLLNHRCDSPLIEQTLRAEGGGAAHCGVQVPPRAEAPAAIRAA